MLTPSRICDSPRTPASSRSTPRTSASGNRRASATWHECKAGATGAAQRDFNMRWIASMVAEVHRILMRGGVFMYPRDSKTPTGDGRLRLLYEANPMRFLVEQAGGQPSPGCDRMLDVKPDALHQRVPADPRLAPRGRAHRALSRGVRPAATTSRIRRRSSASARSSAWKPERPAPVEPLTESPRMSVKHPDHRGHRLSGAGTTSVMRSFEHIFRREQINAADRRRRRLPSLRPPGDAAQSDEAERARGDRNFSHFGPEANLFEELEALFRELRRKRHRQVRKYLHDASEAAPIQAGRRAPSRRGTDSAHRNRPAVLRRPARRVPSPTRSTSRGMWTC